jgi:hypothetical protein
MRGFYANAGYKQVLISINGESIRACLPLSGVTGSRGLLSVAALQLQMDLKNTR